MSLQQEALAWYRHNQRSTGKIVSTVPQPFHTCFEECHLVPVPASALSVDTQVFVCTRTLNIHTHSDACREALPGGEGYVCKLTGYILGNERVLVRGPQRDSKCESKLKTNDHWTSTRTYKRRRTSSVSRVPSVVDCERVATECLRTIFLSDERKDMYAMNVERFKRDSKKAVRKMMASTGGHMHYAPVCRAIHVKQVAMGMHLNAPPDSELTPGYYGSISKALVAYFFRIKGFCGFDVTIKTIKVFTLFMASRLSSGMLIQNTVIIRQHAYFNTYGLTELQHGKFTQTGVRCIDMTTMSKRYKRGCQSAGAVRPECIFELEL